MLLRRNGDRARLRRRDFNHALSATEHYSVSSPGLADSKRATEHGKTIGFRASGVRCDSRHATSVRKRKRLGGASRFIPLQSVRAAQPRMGLGRRIQSRYKIREALAGILVRLRGQLTRYLIQLCVYGFALRTFL